MSDTLRFVDDRRFAALRDLMAAFDDQGLRAVVIGGIAASLLGKPRYTEDIDALLMYDTAKAQELLDAMSLRGFRPRFGDMANFAVRARLVTLTHEATGTVVDIMLGCMPFDAEVIDRSQNIREQDIALRLPSPEDLIILKAIANRPKDQEDIRNIVQVYPNLDRTRVRYWVKQYSELLEAPELWDEIEPLLEVT